MIPPPILRPPILRPPVEADLAPLATLWHQAWHEAHGALVPAVLVRARTRESFADRLPAMLARIVVAGPEGAPLGFAAIEGDEMNQLFVAPGARGTGVAAALIAAAERRLAASGVERAWLACAIGNHRAARFYARAGWAHAGVISDTSQTPDGPVEHEAWRYEKTLHPATETQP
ncbi:MAG: GNAT family N-acetyltransferase [Pseudomonadota bacterium]